MIGLSIDSSLKRLLREVRNCSVCEEHLPRGSRLAVQVNPSARIMIIGQAPGYKVHESGMLWNDASEKRLLDWLEIDETVF